MEAVSAEVCFGMSLEYVKKAGDAAMTKARDISHTRHEPFVPCGGPGQCSAECRAGSLPEGPHCPTIAGCPGSMGPDV